MLQGRRRRLVYNFRDESSGLQLYGEKVLGYSDSLPRLAPGLLALDVTIRDGQGHTCRGGLKVNVERLLNPGLYSVSHTANLPQALCATGGVAAFFMRALLATNFWEFAGTQYPVKTAPKSTPPRTWPGTPPETTAMTITQASRSAPR